MPSVPDDPWAVTPARTRALDQRAQASAHLSAGEIQAWTLALPGGSFAELDLEQRQLDVAVRLLSPHDVPLLDLDQAEGPGRRERVAFVAAEPGTYRLLVRSLGAGPASEYRVRVVTQRAANEQDARHAAALRWLSDADRQAAMWSTSARRAARELYERAERAWAALPGRSAERVSTRRRLAMALADAGQRTAALALLEATLKQAEELDDPQELGRVLLETGPLLRRAGRAREAARCYERALSLARAAKDQVLEASVLNNSSVVSTQRGLPEKGLEEALDSIELWESAGRLQPQIEARGNASVAYTWLGRTCPATGYAERAMQIARAFDDPHGQIDTLIHLGWLRFLERDASGALRHYGEALALAQKRGDRESEAGILDRRGSALSALRRPTIARASFEESLKIWEQLHDERFAAYTTANMAALAASAGDVKTASTLFDQVIAYFRRASEPHNEAHACLQRARLLLDQRPLDATRDDVHAALGLMQVLRRQIQDPAQRAFYVSKRHDSHELLVEVLMRQGDAAGAFEAAENGRALALLDSLSERGACRTLAPLGLSRSLLDEQTLLLSYALGEERSYAFVVKPGGSDVRVFELPKRDAIETLARAFHEALQLGNRPGGAGQTAAAAAELSRVLLAPLASELGTARLAILRDDVLQYVPFAALPDPSVTAQGEPRLLIDTREVVYGPSVAVVAQLRCRARERARVPLSTAVFADPVFPPADPRGPRAPPDLDLDLRLALEDVGLHGLQRLPDTAKEAAAIVSIAGATRTRVFSGFDATVARVKQPDLRDFQLLHFATHALSNSRNPNLSGLVLSLSDAAGKPVAGFLRVGDIERLGLRADLVVLSACRTALGTELRGEGHLGLTQAFMRGGATRVMASLWPVEDTATAALMTRFYEALARRHSTPAGALREAQLALRSQPRSTPAHWAGFILEGDW